MRESLHTRSSLIQGRWWVLDLCHFTYSFSHSFNKVNDPSWVNTEIVQYLLLLLIHPFPRTFHSSMSLWWLTSECCWHLRRHGFSGQQSHGPTGKPEASERKAIEEWNLASHEWEYLTWSTPKKKKRRGVEIQLVTFSAYMCLLCTASRYGVWKVFFQSDKWAIFPLAIWVWIRKITRSGIHSYCQSYKPITLGHQEMRLRALAIWVTLRYCALDRVSLLVHFSKFQVARKKYVSLKFQYLTNVRFLPFLLQEHQIFGCEMSMRTQSNLTLL